MLNQSCQSHATPGNRVIDEGSLVFFKKKENKSQIAGRIVFIIVNEGIDFYRSASIHNIERFLKLKPAELRIMGSITLAYKVSHFICRPFCNRCEHIIGALDETNMGPICTIAT